MTFVDQLHIEYAEFKKKEAAAKFAKAQATKQAGFMKKQQRQAKAKRADASMLCEDELHYADAPVYAHEHYGDVFFETTRFDNDWN